MIKSRLICTVCVCLSIASLNANSALVSISFDSLEVNDSSRYNLSSYTEGGLTFTGPATGAATGIFYDGQSGQAYQGSAAIYVAPAKVLTIETQDGVTITDLVSIDIADLCGAGSINGQCTDPGHDIYFGLSTYYWDGTTYIVIATQNHLLSTGVIGGFNTFLFPTIFDGFGVDKIEIIAQSGTLAYLQIDNLVIETSTVPLPAAAWLFGIALIGLAGFTKRRKAGHG